MSIKNDGVKFSKENQPNGRGRPKGSLSRSTILNKWLTVKAKVEHPETKKLVSGTVEDEIALALIAKAIAGDVAAIKEILDSVYGKIKDKQETSFDLSNLSDEELLKLAEIRNKM